MQLSLALERRPDIEGWTTVGGVDLWYCRRRCVWTKEPQP